MAGHLFVLRGDLTKLQCSAIIVPCDSNWEVVWDHWSSLLEDAQFARSDWGRRQLRSRPSGGRYADLPLGQGPRIRLVVTANGDNDEHWVTKGVVEAIENFSSTLKSIAGRAKPLVALPLVGTGEGGFVNQRGSLINALIVGLRKVTTETEIDVALVLLDERDHVAVQAQRGAEHWGEFSRDELLEADKLGKRAARRELSLFLGAGVSVPLGLPNWRELLEKVGGEPLPDYSPDRARFIAQDIEARIGTQELHDQVADELTADGFAPAHLLLAALDVHQTVTTNYDAAYETAMDGSLGHSNYRVLTRELADQPDPWVLKIHGDVRKPDSIVITKDDYDHLESDFGSLHAVVESLLITSHLMFVGYSMADHDFLNAAARVRTVRALADDGVDTDFATVLALHPGAVKQQQGFLIVAMLKDPDDQAAARRLEIFLDRISWAAARQSQRSHAYLLDEDYKDLFDADSADARFRAVLRDLVDLPQNDPARSSGGWRYVEAMITDLGGRARATKGDDRAQ